MMWRSKSYDWKRRFLLLPTEIGGEVHWLVWCWKRFAGDCYEVDFGLEPPRAAQVYATLTKGEGDE